MVNPVSSFIGKVPMIYAISLVLVFLTWIFALIVGANGQDLFNAAFALTAIELVVPLAVMIVIICLACNIVMPIILPYLEFLFGLIIAAATGATSIFGFELTLTNPFTGITWVELDPDIYVSQLLDILDAIHNWMTFGVTDTATATAEVLITIVKVMM